MKYAVEIADKTFSFSNKTDAEAAQDMLYILLPNTYSTMHKLVDPLAGWAPDKGDMYALEEFARANNRIPSIKFARMKSGAGLKETKDWVEVNFW